MTKKIITISKLFLVLFVVVLQILLFPLLAKAQEPPNVIVDNARVALSKIDYTNFPNVKITASVTDKNGQPLNGLGKQDFKVFENGVEQKILSVNTVKSVKRALSVVLILDTSGSMQYDFWTGADPIGELKASAKEFINTVPANWKAGIILFNENVKILSNFTNDKSQLDYKIDLVQAGGMTALYDAIKTGIDIAKNEPDSGTILVFTDGVDNASAYSSENEVINTARSLNLPIYTIGYTGSDGINANALQNIATASKGRFYESPSLDEISRIYKLIPQILESQYEITYISNFQGNKGEKIKTGVIVKDPATGKWIEGQKEYISPKAIKKIVPVIVIPGIMGSMPKPTLITIKDMQSSLIAGYPGGLINYKLGPPQRWKADGSDLIITPLPELQYYDLINWLEKYGGYERRKTLFTFPYNWSLPNEKSAFYLKKEIDRIKSSTNSDKVDIIAHSMGGLVARAYIEGVAEDNGSKAKYGNDVRYLIMLGTPNKGSVKAYYTWEGGHYREPCINGFGDNIVDTLLEMYTFITRPGAGIIKLSLSTTLPLVAMQLDDKERLDYIHKWVKSVQQLLPVHDYIDNRNSYPENPFLKKLNESNTVSDTKYSIIRGTGQKTLTGFKIELVSSPSGQWQDGEPIEVHCNGSGDGTVLETEALTPGFPSASSLSVAEEHINLPCNKDVVAYIIEKLRNKKVVISDDRIMTSIKKKAKAFGKPILFSIVFASPCNVVLSSPSDTKIGYDPLTDRFEKSLPNALYYGPEGDGAETFFLLTPEAGKYKLDVVGTGNGEVHSLFNLTTDEGTFEKKTTFYIRKGETKTLYFTLDSDDPTKSSISGTFGNKTTGLLIALFFIIGGSMLLLLLLLTKQKTGSDYYLFDGKNYYPISNAITIGRGKDCTLILNDSKVSRMHAKILQREKKYIIQDLGSKNGTFVNTHKISSSMLNAGDQIKIGDNHFTFVLLHRKQKQRRKPRYLRGRYLLIQGRTGTKTVPITKKSVTIGRDRDCDIVVDEPAVSNRHIMLTMVDNERFLIEDLNSKNGTYINGKKIKKASIRRGESFRIGKLNIMLK